MDVQVVEQLLSTVDMMLQAVDFDCAPVLFCMNVPVANPSALLRVLTLQREEPSLPPSSSAPPTHSPRCFEESSLDSLGLLGCGVPSIREDSSPGWIPWCTPCIPAPKAPVRRKGMIIEDDGKLLLLQIYPY